MFAREPAAPARDAETATRLYEREVAAEKERTARRAARRAGRRAADAWAEEQAPRATGRDALAERRRDRAAAHRAFAERRDMDDDVADGMSEEALLGTDSSFAAAYVCACSLPLTQARRARSRRGPPR